MGSLRDEEPDVDRAASQLARLDRQQQRFGGTPSSKEIRYGDPATTTTWLDPKS